MNQKRLLVFLLSWLLVIVVDAQPPTPFAVLNGQPSENYYAMVPFKMSIRHSTASTWLMLLNGRGEVVYYRTVPMSGDFKQHADGRFSYFCKGQFYILDTRLNLIDSVACVNGVKTDAHDFLILKDGSYVLLSLYTDTMDCHTKRLFNQRELSGSKRARVSYGGLQHLSAKKKLLFEWKSLNQMPMEDVDSFFLNDTLNIDLTHFNSLEREASGNYLISSRHYNQVIAVSSAGKLVYKLGGKNATLKMVNDSVPFLGQHDVRVLRNNHITVYDNGYHASESMHTARVLEYQVDLKTANATLVWQLVLRDSLVSKSTGSYRRLANGDHLINYGQVYRYRPNSTFEHLDANGNSKLKVGFNDTIGSYRVYEVQRSKLKLPHMQLHYNVAASTLSVTKAYTFYRWSTGETTETIRLVKPGNYYVYVSNDGIAFYRSTVFELKVLKN